MCFECLKLNYVMVAWCWSGPSSVLWRSVTVNTYLPVGILRKKYTNMRNIHKHVFRMSGAKLSNDSLTLIRAVQISDCSRSLHAWPGCYEGSSTWPCPWFYSFHLQSARPRTAPSLDWGAFMRSYSFCRGGTMMMATLACTCHLYACLSEISACHFYVSSFYIWLFLFCICPTIYGRRYTTERFFTPPPHTPI